MNFCVHVVLKSLLQIPHKKSPTNLYLVIKDPQQICWYPSTAQDLARSKIFVSQPFPGYLPDSKLSFSCDFQHTPAAAQTNIAPLNFNRALIINWIFSPITCAYHLATKYKWIFHFSISDGIFLFVGDGGLLLDQFITVHMDNPMAEISEFNCQ